MRVRIKLMTEPKEPVLRYICKIVELDYLILSGKSNSHLALELRSELAFLYESLPKFDRLSVDMAAFRLNELRNIYLEKKLNFFERFKKWMS